MSGLCILGFNVEVEVENLHRIELGQMTILEIRQKLNRGKVPNAVVGDSIIAAPKNPSELNKLGLSSHAIDLNKVKRPTLVQFLDIGGEDNILSMSRWPSLVARLASSAVGIYLRGIGMHKSGMKFYRDEGTPLEGGKVYKHEAFKVSVHRLEDGYILAVDPCYKLEVYEPISELDVTEKKIDWVKIRGYSSFSFEILEIIDKPSPAQLEKAERAAKALSFLDPSLPLPERGSSSSVAKVTPKSLLLRKHLDTRNLVERDFEDYMPYIFFPCELLYPVASLDQLKALGVDSVRLWMKPSERYEKAIEFIKKMGSKIEVGGVRVEFKDKNPVSVRFSYKVNYGARVKDIQGRPLNIQLKEITNKKLWEEIIPLKKGLTPKVVIACTNDDVSNLTLKAFREWLMDNLSAITKGRVEVELLKSSEGAASGLDDVIEEVSGFNAVVLVGKGDDEEYAWFEYELSSIRNVIPQYVNGQKFTSTAEKKDYIKHISFPIAKSLAWKLGWRYVKIEVPERLGDAVVVGIDRTYVRTGKGVSLAVAAVLQSADGLNMKHLPPKLVESEEEAVLRVVDELKWSEIKGRQIIFCLNRSFVPEKLFAKLKDIFGESLIVVCASKTHSMSRLLWKTERGVYNPRLGTYAVLEENSQHGRYFVASSSINFGNQDRTINPVLTSIEVVGAEIKARDVLHYVFSTQALCIETPYNVASLPWPLHRAHNLSEKISKIARITRNIPQNLDVL
ncbi:MAG: hypothetical protein QXT37_06440 [Thermofilaceae archaeon]